MKILITLGFINFSKFLRDNGFHVDLKNVQYIIIENNRIQETFPILSAQDKKIGELQKKCNDSNHYVLLNIE